MNSNVKLSTVKHYSVAQFYKILLLTYSQCSRNRFFMNHIPYIFIPNKILLPKTQLNWFSLLHRPSCTQIHHHKHVLFHSNSIAPLPPKPSNPSSPLTRELTPLQSYGCGCLQNKDLQMDRENGAPKEHFSHNLHDFWIRKNLNNASLHAHILSYPMKILLERITK